MLTEQGRRGFAALTGAALVTMLVFAGAAQADSYRVSLASVKPGGGGSMARPKAVAVGFGLGVRADNPTVRPAPIKTYVIGIEGVLAFPTALPRCSVAQAKARKGPPKACGRALIGSGVIRAAAGFIDDTSIGESLPCNLRLRVYNTGSGLALRVDTDTPIPPSFRSPKIGCPVPIHTAIPGRFLRTTIDGMPAMDLSFTLPKRLLRPLQDWEGAPQLVQAAMSLHTGKARVKGQLRDVGYFSEVGCKGGERTVQATFVDEDGKRSETTRTIGC